MNKLGRRGRVFQMLQWRHSSQACYAVSTHQLHCPTCRIWGIANWPSY